MGSVKKYISWILLIVFIIIGLVVGRSIWYSLKDTRAKLKAQDEKMAELIRKDASMRAYVDSLDGVLLKLREEERRLEEERTGLQDRLRRLQSEYDRTMARIDTLWEAGSILTELGAAFPHWKGQFWEATRADGIHGLIAPRFFGAEVVEMKSKLDESLETISIKDSTIASMDHSLRIKDESVCVLTFKADSLKSTYENLWGEYGVLDKKYRDLLKKKWFTLRLSPANLLTTGAGLAAGYGVRSLIK
ncbi:MAG: hypothetical protein ABIL68_17660 [bacterium]